jgi:hypothetical protein
MFSPDRIAISNISNANPAVVTTSTNHNLTTGQVVRLHVPIGYGMTALNQVQAIITVLTPTTFSLQETQVPVAVNINTLPFDAFITVSNPRNTAEVIPMGAGPTPIQTVSWEQQNNVCVSLLDDATVNLDTSEIPF